LYLKFLHFAVRNVFIQPPLSDTTTEWGLIGLTETIYVCDTKYPLKHFHDASDLDSLVDHLMMHFPGLQQEKFYSTEVERLSYSGKLRSNAVLWVDKEGMELLSYPFDDDNIEFAQSCFRTSRGDQGELVKAFLDRRVHYVAYNGKNRVDRRARPVGTQVILVCTAELSRKLQPTLRQYQKMAEAFASKRPVEVLRESGCYKISFLPDESWRKSLGPEPAEDWRESLKEDPQ
jgi:hypothetical protein